MRLSLLTRVRQRGLGCEWRQSVRYKRGEKDDDNGRRHWGESESVVACKTADRRAIRRAHSQEAKVHAQSPVVAIVILSNAARVICAIGKTVTDSEMDVLLFVFGLGIGVPLGFFVNSFFSFILLILFGERSDELMLKFYDELKSRELGVPGADGSGDQQVAGCNQ